MPETTRRPQGGPSPLVPALAYGALMVASVATAVSGPRTSDAPAQVLQYARDHVGLMHVTALLGFAAAVPLAIWSAVAYRRLRTLGVTAPGAVIGLVGGTLASASAALSGLITWVLADEASVVDASLAHVLIDLNFVTGAAGFVVPVALLLAGVAVPSLILRLVPRPLAWAGLVIAAIGMLSTFTLVAPVLDPALPIGRFGSLLWIVAASVLMPATRHQVTAARAARAAAA